MMLQQLISAVEAGVDPGDAVLALPDQQTTDLFYAANRGSLDAAKRLHDALLPERYGIALQYCERFAAKAIICDPMDGQNWRSGDEWIDPARAWLLAILRAMEGRDG